MADEINRRDFVKTTAAACALYAATNPTSTLAADSDDLARLTISEAARRIRSKEITATQLVQACLERIKVFNPKVNAYITVMQGEALAQAAQLDNEAKAGNFRGALHGVPIALKDNIDTAGTRTTGGSAVFDDRFPDAGADVVRRLRADGAVSIWQAKLHE